jgi:hypothetical protein
MKKAERNKRQKAERLRDHAAVLLANAVMKGNEKQAKRWREEGEAARDMLTEMTLGRRFDALTGVVHSVDPDTGEDV